MRYADQREMAEETGRGARNNGTLSPSRLPLLSRRHANFTGEMPTSFGTLRDDDLNATRRPATGAKGTVRASNLYRDIMVQPGLPDTATIALPAAPDCVVESAMWMSDGRNLYHSARKHG